MYGLYVNQPSRLLPLAQEAKKLAKRIKEEEEASQWSGIQVEQLLNNSFTEQLNCIQSLQQIAPLHSAKDHLLQDICDVRTMYRQAYRLTDASRPSFCASEHLTNKVGNPVEAGPMVWKDSTLPGCSKVVRVHIDMRLRYYF